MIFLSLLIRIAEGLVSLHSRVGLARNFDEKFDNSEIISAMMYAASIHGGKFLGVAFRQEVLGWVESKVRLRHWRFWFKSC